MPRFLNLFYYIVCLSLLFPACNGKGREAFVLRDGDTLVFRHASLLQLVEYEEYTYVTIRNPWDRTKVLHSYVLLPDTSTFSKNELPEATVLQVPLKNTIVSSSVHCSLFDELGTFSSIIGVCDLKYIRLKKIHEACQNGMIQDVGSSMAPDVERIFDMQAEALFISPFEGNKTYGRLAQMGIPLIECADYMETSPLGRAEWMRFYGRLFGCKAKADSLFDEVERNYLSWADKVASEDERPTLLCDLPMTSSIWYVPGGQSTTGRIYTDAGANYLFADYTQNGSVPLTFESVYECAQDADVWLIRYHDKNDMTYQSLLKENEAYSHFRAYRKRQIYVCNTAVSCFYEEVPFHPERLLYNLIGIFHPELIESDDSLSSYYQPLIDRF